MKDRHARVQTLFPVGELTLQRPTLGFVTVPKDYLRAVILHLRDLGSPFNRS